MRYEDAARQRIRESAGARRALRLKAAAHPSAPWRAEPEHARRAAFEARLKLGCGSGCAEALQGPTIDFQPVCFLMEGARVSHAVAMVHVKGQRPQVGSGFMISPDLFITNHHVIGSIEEARDAAIEFNFENDPCQPRVTPTMFALDPARCFVTADEDDLDFTVVAIGPRISGDAELASVGCCPLSDAPDKHALGMAVNIVQHPEGRPKCVVIRNNPLTHRTPRTLLYEADTDQGSSGSPVFNDAWDVVALHHWGEPHLDPVELEEAPSDRPCNEGVRVSCIVKRLRQERGSGELAARAPAAAALIDAALGLADHAPPAKRPVIEMCSAESAHEASPASPGGDGALHAMIPLEITLRIGAAQPLTPQRVPVIVTPSAAERLVLDEDYTGRTGYDASFLEGFVVPLPVPEATLVAPLRRGPHDAGGELRYEHFSVKIHAQKRMALFTATNIDGQTYIAIDRKTGRAGPEASERWLPDARMDAEDVIDQTFYSAWSSYFDRGHLTRRSDPTWGDDATAMRANADTFHFPNCTPQHFRFNESTKFWQGVERYILENGGLEQQNRLCVLQGPVLRGAYAKCDDVHVPLKFWKVVAWVGKQGPSVAGFLVSQERLLGEARVGLSPTTASTPIQVEHWRATIATIATQTGLDFGTLGEHDTFKHPGPVGEGLEIITKLEQLVLT